MEILNKLLLRQAHKYIGEIDKIPGGYLSFLQAVSASYDHNEKDRHLLERSIEDEEKIKKLQEIADAIIKVQERERAYLAAELHDNINQILATSRLYLDTAITNESERLNLLTDSKEFINIAMEEIRHLCKSLSPPSLSESSLGSSLNELIENVKQVGNIQITTEWGNIDETKMCEEMKLTIFRIVQEQLNNIFKHAKASTVIIRIIQENEGLQLSIKDDGIGFDISRKRNGIGLQNILNRTNLFNGEAIINSKPGAGCELVIAFNKQTERSRYRIAI